MVRPRGFEPPRVLPHKILSLARLPVPPRPQLHNHWAIMPVGKRCNKSSCIEQAGKTLQCNKKHAYKDGIMIEWLVQKNLVEYEASVSKMEERVAFIREDGGNEVVWMLEHPPLYTAGTSAKDADLLDARFPVYKSGRGGEHTYHGPGQRVAYVLLDLKKRQGGKPDVRGYVRSLEEWVIRTLAEFDVKGERREGRVGIWVDMAPYGGREGEEAKIAAIGVRIRRWVTYHGVAINLNPDLSHFAGIVPCGISDHGVTSLHALGLKDVDMAALDKALKKSFSQVFSS